MIADDHLDGHDHGKPQLSYTMRMYALFGIVGWVMGAGTVIVWRMLFG